MVKISDHITLKEALRSNTARRLGIENMPDNDTLITIFKITEISEK